MIEYLKVQAGGSGIKSELFGHLSRVARALACGPRLEMIESLAQRELTVEQLARLCGLSAANASQHLRILRDAGLVEARKDGLHVYSRLAGGEAYALFRHLRQFGSARLAEVERLAHDYRERRGTLEAISLEELRRRLRSGTVTLLDVRPADEYAAGHIPGAVSAPLATLASRLKRLPRNTEVVAYCRGPYCLLSDDAVAAIRKSGRRARRLEEGFPDWKAMGWEVA